MSNQAATRGPHTAHGAWERKALISRSTEPWAASEGERQVAAEWFRVKSAVMHCNMGDQEPHSERASPTQTRKSGDPSPAYPEKERPLGRTPNAPPTAVQNNRVTVLFTAVFHLSSRMSAPSLLALPQELREEILSYLVLPRLVYTSSKAPSAGSRLRKVHNFRETYLDSRICLPMRPPANILATCRQLREECLVLHTHLLNSPTFTSTASRSGEGEQGSQSPITAEIKNNDFDETAERSLDDTTAVCLTLEVQRMHSSPMGYFVPARDALSPSFFALLPFMQETRKLQLVVWPGFDWLDGERPPSLRFPRPVKPNALTFAIDKILEQIPTVEELSIHILVATDDLFRWDLPDAKWAKIQPWLDRSVTSIGHPALKKVYRTMTTVWRTQGAETLGCQPIYEQSEVRIGSGNSWNVRRKGGLRTVSIVAFYVNSKLTRYGDLPRTPCCRSRYRFTRCQH
jgi:hypothetical protein